MKKLLAALGLCAALTASAALPLADAAEAAMAYSADGAGVLQHQIAPVENVQYAWGGYNYCWYPAGWHGPGWYRCGFGWRSGFGWGGPMGWNGWAWRGGYGWGPGWRRGWGPGWRGGWGWHGGWHGGWRH